MKDQRDQHNQQHQPDQKSQPHRQHSQRQQQPASANSEHQNLVAELTKHRELNQQMQAVMDSSYDGIYLTDGQAKTLYVNRAYERIAGIQATAVMGRNMSDLVAAGVVDQSSSLEAIRLKQQVTIRQVLHNGKEVLVTSTPVFEKEEAGVIQYVVTNVRDVSELVRLQQELQHTRALSERYRSELEHMKTRILNIPEFVIRDRQMLRVLETVLKVAETDTTVLIQGETGSGKGRVTRLIHSRSKRAAKSFIEVNCGAIPGSLMESELFGYEKGAFTGALTKGKMGLFELADGGTLVLDEISEMPLDLQVKLLKALEDGTVFRVGGQKPVPVNVRIITATNQDLGEMVKQGRFREDLYYRLHVVPLYLPPLRERKEDIVPLCHQFLEEFNRRYQYQRHFTPEALEYLMRYPWPGNVRELRNLVERMVVMVEEDRIRPSDLPEHLLILTGTTQGEDALPDEPLYHQLPLKEATKLFQQRYIRRMISQEGSMKRAAQQLEINPSTLYRKLHDTGEESS
ncbi:sigma-54 interaction domain-containing protein [Anoxynatronum sibiricum]|uniref:Sigma 54-interacting transcriptional regulator n=1 Tax=Anoxynatronum sibiricum TaxID=210623 RepID=A0ABU9VTH3_9CLOT